MPKHKIVFLFILFLVCSAGALWAAPATVTNDGNITVRVQYKTPDGQYQDLGHAKPGETINVPGGVEKIRIVREPGEWARPLKPGEILDVEVKEGDKVTGRMNWYGDKVFFQGLTEGLPAVQIGTTPSTAQVNPSAPQNPEPPKSEPPHAPPQKPEGGETPKQTEPVNWPWYGGLEDYLFSVGLFLLWLPFLFLAYRHWSTPRYYFDGEYIESSRLGWGWGWDETGCGRYGILYGFLVGLALGGVALWGHSFSSPGFLPLFGRDLYSFPYYLLSELHWNLGEFSDGLFILLFWTLICTSFGVLSGFMPFKWLYATPCFLAILPLFLFMRGCSCSHPFVFDGGYGGDAELYPPAFATFSSFSLFVSCFLDWVDPYYEMDWDEEDHVAEALWDFFHGNPWPMLVFLTGGCLCCFYGAAYYYGWDYAIGSYFYDAPMSLGLDFIPPLLMIVLFWMGLAGKLGWASYSEPARLPFYLCWIPAFLVLLMLTTGNYPQRDLSYIYRKPLINVYEYKNILPQRTSQQPSGPGDQFGDEFGSKERSNSSGSGRNLLFGVERNSRDRDNNYR